METHAILERNKEKMRERKFVSFLHLSLLFNCDIGRRTSLIKETKARLYFSILYICISFSFFAVCFYLLLLYKITNQTFSLTLFFQMNQSKLKQITVKANHIRAEEIKNARDKKTLKI